MRTPPITATRRICHVFRVMTSALTRFSLARLRRVAPQWPPDASTWLPAVKCSGPPRNGAKPVPKITPASTMIGALHDRSSASARSPSSIMRLDQLAAQPLELGLVVGRLARASGLPSFQT